MKPANPILTGGALVMAVAATAFAQEKTLPPSATTQTVTVAPADQATTLGSFFNNQLPEAFTKGKFNINVRARYEYVTDESPLHPKNSDAFTVRTRFGFTTAPLYGFQGMLEGENISAIGGENHYNAAGSNGQNNRPVVADPTTTEVNQAWVGYACSEQFSTRIGRQRYVLDNQRFIGDVGWRQNMQTFDEASADLKPIKDLEVQYGYIWGVKRVYGNVDDLPAANTDFDSASHLINVSYNSCRYAKLTGYTYLLDLKNAAGPNNSCATYGFSVTGNAPVSEKVTLDYRGEVATQTDYADSTQNYNATYYMLELAANVRPFQFGAGYEVLGSDNNVGFKTPLATLHSFNGWADLFLTTPNNGLRDLYGFAQVTLSCDLPVRVIYHKFNSDVGNADYGHELDAIVSKKFSKNWAAALKYAYYSAQDGPFVDTQKVWAQVEFNF